MGKLRLNLVFLLGLLVFSMAGFAQRISNVTAMQEGQRIKIEYRLESIDQEHILLYFTDDGGSNWSSITEGLSGDIGPEISQGNKVIIWDVLHQRNEFVGDAILFKVKIKSAQEQTNLKGIKIGNQVWMAENLNVDHYRNGDPIPTGLSNAQWESTTQGAYAIYNDDPANEKIYGKLYNWYAVNDARGLCPSGWHVPSDDEWTLLTLSLGGEKVAGGKMKSRSLWSSPNEDATNSSSFNGLPSGYRDFLGAYYSLGYNGYYWSISEFDFTSAWNRRLGYGRPVVDRGNYGKLDGFSVRCVRD